MPGNNNTRIKNLFIIPFVSLIIFFLLVNVANKGLAGEKFEAKASKKEEVIKEEKATAKKTTKTTTKKETTKKATKTTTTK